MYRPLTVHFMKFFQGYIILVSPDKGKKNIIIVNPQKLLTISTISSLMWGQLLPVKFLTATKIRMIISKLVSWIPFSSRQHVKKRLKIYCIDSKIAGWGPFLPQHIKVVRQYIKGPLAYICNRSFKTGFLPRELKIANAIPIYKNSEEYFFTNYRPVSVLPFFKS